MSFRVFNTTCCDTSTTDENWGDYIPTITPLATIAEIFSPTGMFTIDGPKITVWVHFDFTSLAPTADQSIFVVSLPKPASLPFDNLLVGSGAAFTNPNLLSAIYVSGNSTYNGALGVFSLVNSGFGRASIQFIYDSSIPLE